MKTKPSSLNTVVSATMVLLTLGAMLVVLGIFNEFLGWDIFGPRVEAFLYGVFGSCMALAGFGVVMTAVLAVQEAVRDFKRLVNEQTGSQAGADLSSRNPLRRLAGVVVIMVMLIAICATANHIILRHRCTVFKSLAEEQAAAFEDRILSHVTTFAAIPRTNAPVEFHAVMKALQDLDFMRRAFLYLPDTNDDAALWQYQPGYTYSTNEGFAHVYLAKDYEKAVRRAMEGDAEPMGEINGRNEFIFYRSLEREPGVPIAVLRLDGNARANFRQYPLGK